MSISSISVLWEMVHFWGAYGPSLGQLARDDIISLSIAFGDGVCVTRKRGTCRALTMCWALVLCFILTRSLEARYC